MLVSQRNSLNKLILKLQDYFVIKKAVNMVIKISPAPVIKFTKVGIAQRIVILFLGNDPNKL